MDDSEVEPDSNSDSELPVARWCFLGLGPGPGPGLEVGPLQENPEKAEIQMPCLVLEGLGIDGGASFP